MRNADGQLYTIEGIAAGLIMIMTAYLVVNATSVYTAGDTHINDMQLEALGSDALKMMGTPVNTTMNSGDTSPLRTIIENNDTGTFRTMFLNLTNNRTGLPSEYINRTGSTMDYIQFNASVTCRNITNHNVTETVSFSYSRNMTGGEHTVRATKWVVVDKLMNNSNFCGTNGKDRAVLVEVLLWRD
ncbi:MAG: hypothetical protein WC294_05200 [Methanoregula sp.]|jgi:hypothetical protein